MEVTEIKFEREDLEGIIPIGTYLADAARRLGVELWQEPFGETEFSVVKIIKGSELLSAPTKAEVDYLSAERRIEGERLAEQARIEQAGAITIMTTKKPEEVKPDYEAKREEYRKEFEELPLEKKIASLVELEAIAFSETVSFVINSPYLIVGKFVDVLAQFGFKMEDEAKRQARPAEHHSDGSQPSVTKKNKKAEAQPKVTEEHKTTGKTKVPPASI